MSILDPESRRRGSAHHGDVLSGGGRHWATCRDCEWLSTEFLHASGASLAYAEHVAKVAA